MPRPVRLAIAVGVVSLGAMLYLFATQSRDVQTASTPPGVVATSNEDLRPISAGLEKIVLGSGCFWCTESDFDALSGVVSTTSGYTGGRLANPTYGQVSAGGTGHVEAVEVVFDPRMVSLSDILDHYWHNVDFFNDHGQFCDYGEQYRPVIFVRGSEQRERAEQSRQRLQNRFSTGIVVEIREASVFYPAETYHQDYYLKNPLRYRYYRWSCGRDARLSEIWRE
jgi:methionine-S-sulfoxide reductase